MSTYKCYIVDDEPLAIRVLEQHLTKYDQMQVAGSSTSAVKALNEIREYQPDLLFLDIQMPDLTGLQLLDNLTHRPQVILVTAYRDFAVEGFEYDVLDYLVKPVSFPRFAKAIERFLQSTSADTAFSPTMEGDHIFVRTDRKMMKISFADILYIEGVKDYVRIALRQQNVLTKTTITALLQSLPAEQFIQTHKSYIVAKDKITAYTAMDIEIGKIEIPIGRVYKEAVMQYLEKSGKTS